MNKLTPNTLISPKWARQLRIFHRLKHMKTHWASKKLTNKDRALEHFDDFYKNVFGARWNSIRIALLSPHKYCAIVNNFSDTAQTITQLENAGAINMRSLINLQTNTPATSQETASPNVYQLDATLQKVFQAKLQEETDSIYPSGSDIPVTPQVNETLADAPVTQHHSLISSLEAAAYDTTRLVDPDIGLSTSALYEYIPATKLKGMEDWVLESDHYRYYENTTEFPVQIKAESTIHFPECLNVFSFERGNIARFPTPSKGSTGVLNYYLMDGGSLLPVLALGLQPGDKVLDMCAAPGGKSLLMLQTLYPDCIVCNDVQSSRTRRLTSVFKQYLYDYEKWGNRLVVTKGDARALEENNCYNRILVDVPCTTDRHSLLEDSNNIFKPTRTKERLRLPELQAAILTNALKLVTVGGTVVYATCSLSPIQNDGVVHMALKEVWQETNIKITVSDLTEALQAYKCFYRIEDRLGLKYGNLVIPFLPNNFGPMYFCKMERTE